ncbi:MAG: TIGR00266 family protein [Candidatus Thermoplasmatota archaeon]
MSQCPMCGGPLTFIMQYKQWYCYHCQAYQQPVQQQSQQPPQQTAQAQPSAYQQPYQQAVQPIQVQPSAHQEPYPQAPQPEHETVHSPSFTALVFHLKQGQAITAEPGAMMYMHRTIEIDTHGRKGGVLRGLAPSMLGGESFFVNTYTAVHGHGDLALVGAMMGDIRAIDLSAHGMILQSGAYLASEPQVALDTKWQGLKGFLAERDFVMLHASGPGNVWVSSFGGIMEKELQAGEPLSVDTGHLVAFPDHIQFSVRRIGGLKSTLLSGEGLVTDLVGPGKILLQTRHLPAFVEALMPYLPQQR